VANFLRCCRLLKRFYSFIKTGFRPYPRSYFMALKRRKTCVFGAFFFFSFDYFRSTFFPLPFCRRSDFFDSLSAPLSSGFPAKGWGDSEALFSEEFS